MKVVLFCGGLGMRLREHSEAIPKPMVPVGPRPILWHLMKYYAHYGHKDFILCLGWNADYIKNYFLNYNECVTNDFTLEGSKIRLHGHDMQDWSITFVDTGQTSVVGERLAKVRPFLKNEPRFLANYADGLSDVNLDQMLEFHKQKSAVASCLCIKPTQSFHLIDAQDGVGTSIRPVSQVDSWMNGGFFILNQEVFDYIQPGEDLACQPFERLIDQQKLACYTYDGFWGCMDTYKEKLNLDEMYYSSNTPWQVWSQESSEPSAELPNAAAESELPDTVELSARRPR